MADSWPEDEAMAQFNYDAKAALADHSVRMYEERGAKAYREGVAFADGPKRHNNLIPMFSEASAQMADAWERGWTREHNACFSEALNYLKDLL